MLRNNAYRNNNFIHNLTIYAHNAKLVLMQLNYTLHPCLSRESNPDPWCGSQVCLLPTKQLGEKVLQ